MNFSITAIYSRKPAKLITRLLLVISAVCLSFMLVLSEGKLALILSITFTAIAFTLATFKLDFIEKTFTSPKKILIILCIVLSFFTCFKLAATFYDYALDESIINKLSSILPLIKNNPHFFIKWLAMCIGILSMFILAVILYKLYDLIVIYLKTLFSNLDKSEKIVAIIIFAVLSITVIVCYNITNVFYLPQLQEGKNADFDIIYRSDTGNLVRYNVFFDINHGENDIRQPLFAVFSFPFSLPAYLISNLMFFIPNLYEFLLGIMDVFLIALSLVSLYQIINIRNCVNKIIVYCLFVATYPLLLFSLNIEQYQIAQFWLMMFLYSNVYLKKQERFSFLGATETLTTSGILFPLLINRKQNFKTNIKSLSFLFIQYFVLISLFGKLDYFINIFAQIKSKMRFFGISVTWTSKIYQYFNFIKSCFIAPASQIITTGEFAQYTLSEANNIDVIGLMLLILSITGFALNYRNKFAQICFGWILFSIAILFVVGWGTAENGLILYSLYFGWAFFSLIIMLIEKIPIKYNIVKTCIYATALITVLLINIPAIIDLINFGITYYPA